MTSRNPAALAALAAGCDAWSVHLYNVTDASVEEGDAHGRLGIIFPGTKWCGSGNVASDYDDLGQFADTDACCRAHDSCPDVIEAGQMAHGLTNKAFYTRLECTCDEKFYDCLKAVDSPVSFQVGVAYFNLLNTQCYRKDYPIVECRRYSTIIRSRCLEYQLDESAMPKYQWFDVPLY
ncbi:phospholipase A2-like [Schistocerca piceifrons]|uniref:phospholipase A2-like n=1 Tax=Schistocerca piceifrons TaxID=274613 RepID=UPI001F5F1D4F|nr:phospholipase A2-like [Schistocerca piceifrons]